MKPERKVKITAVPRSEPDYRKLVEALIIFAKEQMDNDEPKPIDQTSVKDKT